MSWPFLKVNKFLGMSAGSAWNESARVNASVVKDGRTVFCFVPLLIAP
jgi:hypothetical protein